MADPLAPFDDDLVSSVADEYGLEQTVLRDRLRSHQAVARENPGVSNLLYEWRKYLPYDPLLARTDVAYVCLVRPAVWEEYALALDVDLDAARAVHDRQARRLVEDAGEARWGEETDGAWTAIVLARE